MNRKLPLIVICGGTGTGKSQLSIELAKKYGGEIINCDAIQFYKGMDIATNKITKDETEGIPHHMLGHLEPSKLDYSIQQFQKEAIKHIDSIRERNKFPILVGGTSYYIESILWERLIPVSVYDQEDAMGLKVETHPLNKGSDMSNEDLHAWLKQVDENSAFKLHPNNRRKVWRALEIALLGESNQHDYLENKDTNKRRFNLEDVIIFWLHSKKESLDPRLDKRIDEMVNSGMLSELEEMQELFIKFRQNRKYTKGIFQAIGFKEFQEYLELSDKSTVEASQILHSCIERLKRAHKQYVRYQNRYVRNRFLRSYTDQYPIFQLNVSNKSDWTDEVFNKSNDIIGGYLNLPDNINYLSSASLLVDLPVPHAPVVLEPRGQLINRSCQKICEYCRNRLFVDQEQWQIHLSSKSHHKNVKSYRRRQLLQKQKDSLVQPDSSLQQPDSTLQHLNSS